MQFAHQSLGSTQPHVLHHRLMKLFAALALILVLGNLASASTNDIRTIDFRNSVITPRAFASPIHLPQSNNRNSRVKANQLS